MISKLIILGIITVIASIAADETTTSPSEISISQSETTQSQLPENIDDKVETTVSNPKEDPTAPGENSGSPTTEPAYDCNAILIERIHAKCCKLPVLIPPSVAEICHTRDVTLEFRRRYPGYKRGPMCLHDCAFREMHFLQRNEEESLDTLAITSKFLENTTEPWKNLVRENILSCKAELENRTNIMDSVLLTKVGDNCTVFPLHFMKCLKKKLILSCPPGIKATDGGDECANDLERLEGCSPFFMTHQQNSRLMKMRKPNPYPVHHPLMHNQHHDGHHNNVQNGSHNIPETQNPNHHNDSYSAAPMKNSPDLTNRLFGISDKKWPQGGKQSTEFDEWKDVRENKEVTPLITEETTEWSAARMVLQRNHQKLYRPKFSRGD